MAHSRSMQAPARDAVPHIDRSPSWLLGLLVPPLAAVLAYAQAIGFGVVWDDALFLVRLPAALDASLLARVNEPLLAIAPYFRPLPQLAFALELWVPGGGLWLSHAVNVAIHAANATLVALLVRHALRHLNAAGARTGRIAAALGGGLYALHPAHVEAVSWISGRFDLLMAMFALAALAADQAALPARQRALAVGTHFFLGSLCKEMIFGLLLVFPLWHMLFSREKAGPRSLFGALTQEGRAWIYGALAIATALHLLLRHSTMGHWTPVEASQYYATAAEHVALCLMSLGQYLELALWPFTTIAPLHFFEPPADLFDRRALLAVGALGALSLGLWRRRKQLAGSPLLLLCCAVAALAPVLHLVPMRIGDNLGHDRFLVLPLAFGAMFVTSLGLRLVQAQGHPWRAGIRMGACSVLAFWVLLSIANLLVTVPLWKDNLSLWSYAYHRSPQSPVASQNLQTSLIEAGRLSDAMHFTDDLRLSQGGTLTSDQQIVLADLLRRMGRTAEAAQQIGAAAAAVPPWDRQSRFNLHQVRGRLRFEQGDLSGAAEDFTEALRLRSSAAAPAFFLGITRLAQDRREEGTLLIEQAVTRVPAATAQIWQRSLDQMIADARKRAAQARASASGGAGR